MLQLHFEENKISKAKEAILAAQKSLKIIERTHALGTSGEPLPDRIFEPTIIRRILFTAPPNTLQIPTFEEVSFFIIKKLNFYICKINFFFRNVGDFIIKTYFTRFSRFLFL